MARKEYIRRVIFRPYTKDSALPYFVLTIEDEVHKPTFERLLLSYNLVQYNADGTKIVLFEGDDFGPSPLHCIDSDETVVALMSFLTLRPGDTDKEYFDKYTPQQLEFCNHYAEDLGFEVYKRFGEI